MVSKTGAAARLHDEWADALAAQGLTGQLVDTVLATLIDHLQRSCGGTEIYIPCARTEHDIAAMHAAVKNGDSARSICKRFRIDRRTLSKLLSERTQIEGEEAAELNFSSLSAAYGAGDKHAPLHATELAAWFKVPVPAWALQPIASAFSAWFAGDSRTIDEALGIQRPKGWRQKAHKQRNLYAVAVYLEAHKRMVAGESYSELLFEEVGACWGMGTSRAKKLYVAVRCQIAKHDSDKKSS